MGNLLAIDGFNIVRRVYEANTSPDPSDKADAALRHSLSSFRKLLSAHQPSHALAAFDSGGPTWRHALYPQYRANTAPMPAELRERLPGFHEQLSGIGLKVVSVPEAEAGDVIGTAVLRWLGEGRGDAIIASTARNLHGLIAHGAMVWDHFNGEWHDRQWVETKFGIPPELLPDLLALTGNASDGIPGVSKIGVKTAAKLLQGYRSLDRIMAGAGILKTPTGERLRNERDLLYLSRKLVELKTDVRMGVTWKMLAFNKPQSD
ncbi:MAG: putative 5-3 exonuclease [Herminiimonas sp.]|nr:putative 5-3 exonuclease [Herminiimonas sp.]